MPIPRKGLRDIPTHRARKETDLPVYSLYMRIACIEMEKGRRDMERQAAARRASQADRRLSELEREKAALLAAADAGAPAAAMPAGGGFCIHY